MDQPSLNPPLSSCPSDLQLEALMLSLGEGLEAVEAHVGQCPACGGRWRELLRLDRVFQEEVFPSTVDRVTRRVTEKAAPAAREAGFHGLGRRRVTGWAMGIAASALLMSGLYLVSSKSPPSPEPTEVLADKGPIGLEVWCRRAGGVFRVQQGDKLFQGDMIRFVPRFRGEPSRFAMVVSIDDQGTISRYFPASSATAARVEEAGIPLPGSTVLDAVGGPERILLLASTEPFDFESVRRAVEDEQQNGENALTIEHIALDLEQTSLLFYKE